MSEHKRRNIEWLQGAPDKPNLAEDLGQEELNLLGADVVRTYEIDISDRRDWDDLSKIAMKLAKQVKESKSFPWQKCSNVKHPLITVSSIQFAARAYPEIVKGNQVVKCQITGNDPKPVQMPPMPMPMGGGVPMGGGGPMPPPMAGELPGMVPGGAGPMTGGAPPMPMPGVPPGPPMPPPSPPGVWKGPKQQRAERISTHMNYQLTQEMPEWDENMDRALHILPVLGQLYKKTYYHSGWKRNASELVLPEDCVVNKNAKSIDTARRITHRIYFYTNDVWERTKSKIWLDEDLGLPSQQDNQDNTEDPDAGHEFLEQHRWEDLDGDGYKEPYIVTVHKATQKVVRVLARWQRDSVEVTDGSNGEREVGRIEPDHYFTHFGFIPNPDGSMNYLGFGQLLAPINESVNSTLNQLLDAGTLYNAGGGFIGRGARMKGGIVSLAPGEWKMIDVHGGALKENLIPTPVREPSMVLFQLLGFLVQAGKEISSVQDIMTGDAKLAANMPVGTAMALVEQGLKVFTSIYKRIYRSLTAEFKKLYILNARFLDQEFPYFLQGNAEQNTAKQADYLEKDMTVVPIADPTLSSDMQRMLKAQALKDLSGRPGVDEVAITRRLVRAIHPDNEDEVLLTDEQISGKDPVKWKPPPPPQMVVAQAKAQRLAQQTQEDMMRLQMDAAQFGLEMEEKLATIAKLKSETLLNFAKAKDLDTSDQMELLKHQLDLITSQAEMESKLLMAQVKAMAGGNGNAAGGAGTGGPQPGRVARLAPKLGDAGGVASSAVGAGRVGPPVS